MNGYPNRANRPHIVEYFIRAQGLTTADLTIQEGVGIKSIARTGAGAYTITFQNDPGLFINWDTGFGALVPGDLKGYSIVRGVYAPATSTAQATLAFIVYNSSFAAADLLIDQYLDLTISFSEHGN